MHLQDLKAKKKQTQRLLHITKRKKLACKLYLKGNPEQASREMQHYLFTLEQQHKNPRDFITGFLAVVGICIVLISLNGVFNISMVYSASLIMTIFLGGLFFVPFFANQYHMAQTRRFIAEEILDQLEDRISWLNERIESLQEQIDREWSKYEAWRAHSRRQQDQKSEYSSSDKMTYNRAIHILGLQEPIELADVRTAYRKLIIQCHPDRAEKYGKQNVEEAKQKTIELNRAYSKLKEMLEPAG